MITKKADRAGRPSSLLPRAAILAALLAGVPDAAADTGSAPAIADTSKTAAATLRVETLPTGLEVLVDGESVGLSPVGPLKIPPGTVRVRVLARNPRRFEPARDAMDVSLRPDAAVTLFFDVRPSIILRSRPEPARVVLTGRAGAPDSLLGETPVSVAPALVEGAFLRFQREAFLDTTVAGAALAARDERTPRIELRSAGGPYWPAPERRAPIYRKRWVHWTLIGAGAVLSGAAVIFHQQGNEWYERYLDSSDPREIPILYDRALHYDRLAAVSLGAGQVALVGGLVLLLTGQPR